MAVLNPMFIVVAIIFAFLLWCALNIFFPIIGDVLLDMWNDIKRSLSKKE